MVQRGRNAEQPRNCPPHLVCDQPSGGWFQAEGRGNQKVVGAKASGIGICPNVNDPPPPPSRGICTRTCPWTVSSSCLQVARKANQSSFVFVLNYRQTFACWNERVPVWWINHRSRPSIRTFRNWVEESWYSVYSFVIFLLLLLSWMKAIWLDDLYWKEYLRDTRDSKYKITGEFLRRLEENIPIYWKWLREQFCHTPAISHVRNNLRSLWYSPPFHINLSMPQDSPLLTDQFDMILERGEDIYKTVFLQHS